MKIGEYVKFKITSYPYERTGVIIGRSKWEYMIKVEYPKKYMIFKKKEKQIQKVCKNEKY